MNPRGRSVRLAEPLVRQQPPPRPSSSSDVQPADRAAPICRLRQAVCLLTNDASVYKTPAIPDLEMAILKKRLKISSRSGGGAGLVIAKQASAVFCQLSSRAHSRLDDAKSSKSSGTSKAPPRNCLRHTPGGTPTVLAKTRVR